MLANLESGKFDSLYTLYNISSNKHRTKSSFTFLEKVESVTQSSHSGDHERDLWTQARFRPII